MDVQKHFKMTKMCYIDFIKRRIRTHVLFRIFSFALLGAACSIPCLTSTITAIVFAYLDYVWYDYVFDRVVTLSIPCKTSIIAYWLVCRASDPKVVGSSPRGWREFFCWKYWIEKAPKAQPGRWLEINFHGFPPATNLRPLITCLNTTRLTNRFNLGYRNQITK